MSSAANLVLFATKSLWLGVHTVLDWHRQSGPVRRLFIYQSSLETDGPSRRVGEALSRWVRETLPEIRVEIREGSTDPAVVHTQLEAWWRNDPGDPWLLVLPDEGGLVSWGAFDWLEHAGCRVAKREPSGAWSTLQRGPTGEFQFIAEPELRRTATDDLSTTGLVRALIPDSAIVAPFPAGKQAEPIALTRLTEAAIAREWRWREAMTAGDLDPRNDSPDLLFARYLAGLLHELGIRNTVHGEPSPTSTGNAAAAGTRLWVNHSGRLVILDIRLVSGDSSAATAPCLADEMIAAAEAARPLAPLAPVWVLVRPGYRLPASEAALARALGVRVLDESACCELPSQIARLFEVPVSAVAAEVERLLRAHIAQTGRTRVFAPESDVLREQRNVGSDPALVDADRWLEQVRQARGQNWLLWTHHHRLLVRVPADNRPDAAGDWGLLLAVVTGLDRALVQSTPVEGSVVVSLPDQPAHRRRLADWFRPFLNAAMSFSAAQQRLAAEARVHGEAPPVEPPAPRKSVPIPPKPRPTLSRPPASPRRSELSDLDRALDDALGRSDPKPR